MPSIAARLATAYLRRRFKPALGEASNLDEATRALNTRFPSLSGLPSEIRVASSSTGEWTKTARSEAAATLLYLHGGAFFAGSPEAYRPVTRAFAKAGFDVFAPRYRLAPQHPFPAALEDAVAAWSELARNRSGPLVLAGDSAGGGLALALMISLRARGEDLPAAAALFSPWTDLAVAGRSARGNEEHDCLFSRRALKLAARQYLHRTSAKDPLASPLYADLGGLPPLLVHVGADEVLLDDSRRLAERARSAGTSVELEIWPGVPHGWQLGAAFIPEARRSIREAAAFLAKRARS